MIWKKYQTFLFKETPFSKLRLYFPITSNYATFNKFEKFCWASLAYFLSNYKSIVLINVELVENCFEDTLCVTVTKRLVQHFSHQGVLLNCIAVSQINVKLKR